jgi:hypothetical protein
MEEIRCVNSKLDFGLEPRAALNLTGMKYKLHYTKSFNT